MRMVGKKKVYLRIHHCQVEQEPHSLSGHGSTGWFSAQLEPPFPLSYCLLLQRNLWKWKHSHERTVGSESFQPLTAKGSAAYGTSQFFVEALLPHTWHCWPRGFLVCLLPPPGICTSSSYMACTQTNHTPGDGGSWKLFSP